MSRLTTLIDRMFDYDERPCIEDGQVAYSYAETLAACLHCDARLESLNVQPGCVIGLQAENSLTTAALLLAALLRACVVALLPKDRDASACIEETCVEELFSIDADGRVRQQRLGPAKPHPLLDELRLSGQGGIVLFPSGATGKPEAALQSTEHFLARFGVPERPFKTLGVLTLDHMAGLDALFHTFSNGGSFVMAREQDPDSISALIESHRVEVLPVSRDFLQLFCTSESVNERDLSSLKIITTGSEPLDAATLGLINRRFPQIQLARSEAAISSDAHELRNDL
jgi:long-chain acyl-CoA synthetase